jgi:histidine triad (HIT) family protein
MECVFCKIVKGEVPCAKIYEDKDHLAILDIRPNIEGVALVITKKHYDSYVFDLPEKIYLNLLKASKKAAKVLERGLNVKKVAMVFEGQGVNHIHAKLYPMHNIDTGRFGDLTGNIYFKEYPGYITTLTGPEKSIKELKKIAEKIRKEI